MFDRIARFSSTTITLTMAMVAAVVALTVASAGARMPIDDEFGSSKSASEMRLRGDSEAPYQDWPRHFVVHGTNHVVTTIVTNGTFGRGFYGALNMDTRWNESFNVPAEDSSSYLFGGAIWVGGIVNGDTLVSVGHGGWVASGELFPTAYPEPSGTRISHPVSDAAYRLEFVDTNTTLAIPDPDDNRPHVPLGVKLADRSHMRYGSIDGRIILHDLIVSNIGPDIIEECYVGFYFDCDVVRSEGVPGWSDDLTGFLRDSSIGYVIDNFGFESGNLNRAFCFRMLASSHSLADTSYNWWISNGSPEHDIGPRHKGSIPFPSGGTGTPVSDPVKYYVLSNREFDFDQIFLDAITADDTLWEYPNQNYSADLSTGADIRFMMSFGPFDLLPGESERLLFSTFSSGDVHVDSTNRLNLYHTSYQPEVFLDGLDFSTVYQTGAAAKDFAADLLNPAIPPTGVQVSASSPTSLTVEWDPHLFPEVTGYSVALGQVTNDQLDHAGVVPPWLNPDVYLEEVTVGPEAKSYEFTGLDPNSFYFVKVANISGRGVETYSAPVYHRTSGRLPAPGFENEYAFFLDSEFLTLEWTPPEGDVDHYNIYRFEDTLPSPAFYYAFYDSGAAADSIVPDEEIVMGSDTFHYYQVDPWATVGGAETSYPELNPEEGMFYVVTAVEADGYESHNVGYIESVRRPERTHDVLVLTHGYGGTGGLMNRDSVVAFYDRTLEGFDYAIYDWADTAGAADPEGVVTVDWHTFMEYELVIIDDDLREVIVNDAFEATTAGFTKTILSGTKLACFGSFGALVPKLELGTEPGYYTKGHPFVQRFFPFDSIFQVGAGYFQSNGLPKVDTIFGFTGAESVSPEFQSLGFNQGASGFSDLISLIWPPETPPSVSVFGDVDPTLVTHRAQVPDNINSPLENQPVGFQYTGPSGATVSAFGFHLWYMHSTEARGLIFDLLERDCCQNRGNANGQLDGTEYVSISDLTFLVDYVFRGGPGSPCREEADANADGAVDITDLVYLVDFLFRGGAAPPPCP